MKRKHKRYSKPRKKFDKPRIIEEEEIKEKFGLKNKKEIWRADAKIRLIREKAKKLISANPEEQQALIKRLNKIGLDVNSIADILALDKTDYLSRRLQTIVLDKKLATTPKMARQLITHKKVLIDGRVVDSPSYVVPIELENKIKLKETKKKHKREKEQELIKNEVEKLNEEGGELNEESEEIDEESEEVGEIKNE